MRVALDRAGHDYPEYLPDPIRASEDVPPIGEALEHAHYPTSFETRDAALRRLALDELLALQLGMVARRRAPRTGDARWPSRSTPRPTGGSGRRSRPRSPGSSASRRRSPATRRRRSTRSATTSPDPVPMLRLVQGDVGSGKTAVAAWALAAAALAGRQAALLAPTDLLARQHHATLTLAARGPRPADHAAHRLAVRRGPAERDARRSPRGRPRSWSGRTRCSRRRWRSPTSRSPSSTSSTGSAWSSAGRSRRRRRAAPRTSC